MLSFPALRVVDRHEWERAQPTVAPFVRDPTDLPHFAAAWSAKTDVFVSMNRRSIKREMFQLVPLGGPDSIAHWAAGMRPWPSVADLV
jgi:hypothetical protein